MLLLTSKHLSAATISHLKDIQADIDRSPNPVEAAKKAWDSERNKVAFQEIYEVLASMCVGVDICNYCENNEATDIEHILPKSLFPDKAFVWENYLLACSTCNLRYKLDKIAVFSPQNSANRYDILRGTKPPTQDTLIINPREEDPLEFLEVNLRTGIFLEKPMTGTRDYIKAAYTIEILKLNTRETLREARESRAKELFRKLNDIVGIYESSNIAELEIIINATEPFIILDRAKPFQILKDELLDRIRNSIRKGPHPTIWAEIKRQYEFLPKFKALFNRFPELSQW